MMYCVEFVLAEFILEDGKLFTDEIPSKKIPTDMNLRMVNQDRSLVFQRMSFQLIQPKAI